MTRRSPLLLALFLAAACATVPPRPVEPVHVVIVGTTDLHGWFNGHTERPRGGGAPVSYGGLPVLASYLDALRAENPGRVIVVDSGDMFQGTLESNLFEGEPIIRGYNQLGYAAAAVGNHEFDYGPVGPLSVPRAPGDDPVGSLKKNAAMATFPLLSANMVEKATGLTPSWAKKFVMVEAGGARVGIIGLSTPDTPNVTMYENVKELSFTEPVEATIEAARELRRQGADAVVVIAHMGGRCRNVHDVHAVESCETEHEAHRYLQALPPGTIDAYFAGHTHSQMRQIINGVPALQGLAYSTEFSAVDLWIDTAANKVVTEKTSLRPLTMICTAVWSGTEHCSSRTVPQGATLVPRAYAGRVITPDANVAQTIAPYLQQVEAKQREKLGITTTAPFTRNYQRESALGNLLTDAFRAALGTDIAFINSGGIRDNLPAGQIEYGHMFLVSPFDNFPAVVTMTGRQITQALQSTSAGDRGILQVSGLRYTIDEAKDAEKPADERNRLSSLTLENGEPLDPDKVYTVAMPDFLVGGGDAMAAAMKGVPPERIRLYHDRAMREYLIDALKKFPQPLSPRNEGRIKVLNAKQ